MVNQTQLQQLSFRLKNSSEVQHLTGTFEELNEFLADIEGYSINGINQKLGIAFRPKALVNLPKPEKILNSSRIDWKEIYPVQDKLEFQNHKTSEKQVAKQHSSEKTIKGIVGIYPPLVLNTHTTVVCPETGIPFALELPSPLGTGLTMSHPFSRHENVVSFLKSYQRHGKPLGVLSKEVLAGMLMVILKHKGFTTIKPGTGLLVNSHLSQANKAILINALNYFFHRPNCQGYPQINLMDGGMIDFRLVQYMQICRDEDITVQVHYMKERKEGKAKVKVYQTIEAKEHAEVKGGVKTAKVILESLRKDRPGHSGEMFEKLEQEFDSIMFATEKHKEFLCKNLEVTFGTCDAVKSLQLIIKSVDSDAIESDLFSFTQTVEREIEEFKGKKVDLMSLLKQQKKGK